MPYIGCSLIGHSGEDAEGISLQSVSEGVRSAVLTAKKVRSQNKSTEVIGCSWIASSKWEERIPNGINGWNLGETKRDWLGLMQYCEQVATRR